VLDIFRFVEGIVPLGVAVVETVNFGFAEAVEEVGVVWTFAVVSFR
jgi:hypothetical protein